MFVQYIEIAKYSIPYFGVTDEYESDTEKSGAQLELEPPEMPTLCPHLKHRGRVARPKVIIAAKGRDNGDHIRSREGEVGNELPELREMRRI